MTPFEIGMMSFGVMIALVYLGFWVPFVLMLSSFGGVWLIKGSPVLAGKLLALAASKTIASYFFGVVPLFVLMGYIVSVSGMGRDAFDVANHLFRRLKGGLGIGTVGGFLGVATLWRGLRGRAGRFVAGMVLAGTFALVGTQMSWTLRPYLVRPQTVDVPVVRALEGSFLESVTESVFSAAGVFRRPGAR